MELHCSNIIATSHGITIKYSIHPYKHCNIAINTAYKLCNRA